MRITFLRKVTSAGRLQMAGKPTETIYRALLELPESEPPGVSKVKLVTTAASTNSLPGARRSGSTGTLNASCRLASLKQESPTRSGAIDSRKRSNLRRSSSLSGRSMSVAAALWRITCGCYIHAAYSWGMKSDNDYRNTSPRGFRIPYNPASAIPTEPKVQGTRWLDEEDGATLSLARMPGYAGSSLLSSRSAAHCADRPTRRVNRAPACRSVGCTGEDRRLVQDEEPSAARRSGAVDRR